MSTECPVNPRLDNKYSIIVREVKGKESHQPAIIMKAVYQVYLKSKNKVPFTCPCETLNEAFTVVSSLLPK